MSKIMSKCVIALLCCLVFLLTADSGITSTANASPVTASGVTSVKTLNEIGENIMEHILSIESIESIENTDGAFILTEDVGKKLGDNNPLVSHRYGADPWVMEYDGRIYVYTTADEYEYSENDDTRIIANTYSKIKSLYVMSSDDMVNWTDHGRIPVAGADGVAKWASNSWAPSVVWKTIDGEDRFFLYFAESGRGVGVIEGESPIGPWTDPIGKHLVNHSTPNCRNVPWCFDPGVFVDDDGTGYLYFGGGQDGDPVHPMFARMVKLKDNMVEIDGIPEVLDAPFFFEASALHKYNGKYYYIYSTNFATNSGEFDGERPGNADIAYMISNDPMGPFEYKGTALPNQSTFGFGGGNNHSCIFEFKGEWYIAYHTQILYMERHDTRSGRGYRSTSIDKISYDEDGAINLITATREGVPQLKDFNPYEKIEAETMAWSGGIQTIMQDPTMETTANVYVTEIENGDWLGVSGANLGSESPKTFSVSAAGKLGGVIELRAGSPDPESADSELLASINVAAGDGTAFKTESADINADITGTHNLFLVFKGDTNESELFDLDWWRLSNGDAPESEESEVVSNTEGNTETAESNNITADESAGGNVPTDTESNEPEESNNAASFIAIAAGAAALVGIGIFAAVKKKK